MTTSTAETVPSAARPTKTDTGAEKPTTRTQRSGAKTGAEDGGRARYFLAKANGDGSTPVLDREVASEGEALVEALRLGVTYYAIHEFRVIPDFTGRRPQLNKEAVRNK
jgi:hypothetical protein